MTARRVAVRVDANQATGLGHLRRCLTLARHLQSEGYVVDIISHNANESLIDRFSGNLKVSWLEDAGVARQQYSIAEGELWDANATLAVLGIKDKRPAWVVVDSYALGLRWEQTVKAAGYKVLSLDDLRDRVHAADILVSDSGATFGEHAFGPDHAGRVLNGPQYCLLDPEFFAEASTPPLSHPLKRLLVSYGGSDPTGETLKALRALQRTRSDSAMTSCLGQIDVVVGPMNRRSEAITSLGGQCGGVHLHAGLPSLLPLMRTADIVLCAGGNSMIEAVALQKPSLITITAENQESMVATLKAAGLVNVAGWSETVSEQQIVAELAALVAGYAALVDRLRQQTAIDRLGASRIMQAMRDLSVIPSGSNFRNRESAR